MHLRSLIWLFVFYTKAGWVSSYDKNGRISKSDGLPKKFWLNYRDKISK